MLLDFITQCKPSERDFTATELTDGSTYTTWLDGASSSLTRVAKLYNQLGDSDLDLSNANSSGRPYYETSENTIRFDATGYFQYANMFSTASGYLKYQMLLGITQHYSDTTLVLGARKKDDTLYGLPVSSRTLFALRDGYTPSYPYNAKHKAIAIKPTSTYSDDIAISARGDDNTLVIEEHDILTTALLKHT